MIQKDLQGNLWECKIGTMSSGKTFQAYQQEIERLKIIEEKYKDTQLYIQDFKDEIERLNNIINETQKIIFNNAFKFDKWVENENGQCILSQSSYAIKDLSGDKVKEIWDILNKS